MSSARNLKTWQKKDLAFLTGALLVHAAILLIPLKSWHSAAPVPAAPPRMTVDLQTLLPRAEPPPPEEKAPAQTEEIVPAPVETPQSPSERRTARVALEALPEQLVVDPSPDEASEPEAITLKQLNEWVSQSRLENSATTQAERKLGSARAYQPPANWNRSAGAPYLAESDNTFNGMTVPEDVEIVDRWLAADGSQNVVVNLPNGDTLCGRAEAWNPAQPLVEHIMMFRSCGGGGKRTFSMPERYNKGQ